MLILRVNTIKSSASGLYKVFALVCILLCSNCFFGANSKAKETSEPTFLILRNGKAICHATRFISDFLITAGHCLKAPPREIAFDSKKIKIAMVSDTNVEYVNIINQKISDNYNLNRNNTVFYKNGDLNYSGDIAIIKLKAPKYLRESRVLLFSEKMGSNKFSSRNFLYMESTPLQIRS